MKQKSSLSRSIERGCDIIKTAAAYIRVSTEDQVEFSPDSQLKAIRKYAKDHEMILPEEYIFIDEGISGRKADKRPAFQQMIGTAKLKPKQFDVILLWKFSRFARNRQDSIVYKSMLRKQCGIDVVSISEQLGDDNTSVLIEALIEAMDEYYSLNLAEEVKRGMNEKFSRGGVVSQPPFGYKMKDGIFVPDETNAPIVRMIFNDYISGMGARQIAQKLNDMGVRSVKGNLFENRTVEYILTNPVYTGKLRRSKNGRDPLDRFHDDDKNTALVEGAHKAIVSDEVFELAKKRRSENKALYGKYSRQAPAEFMLKGLVRCSNCGATLVYQSASGSIQCHNYARGTCKVSHAVTLKKINALVIDRITSDLGKGLVDINICHIPTSGPEPSSIAALIEKERRKLERVREAYEAGVDTLEEYKQNKSKLLTRIAELEASVPAETAPVDIKADLAERINAALTVLNDPTTSETAKNLSLRSVVDRIVLLKPKSVIEIFYKG